MVRAQSEEQISMVILEANAHQLLYRLTMKGKITLPKTISSTDNPFEHAVAAAVTACRKIIR